MLAELIEDATRHGLCVSFQPDQTHNNYINIVVTDKKVGGVATRMSYEALRVSLLSTDKMLSDRLAQLLNFYLEKGENNL